MEFYLFLISTSLCCYMPNLFNLLSIDIYSLDLYTMVILFVDDKFSEVHKGY